MLFNSTEFLYFFLPLTFVVFWQLREKQSRYIWLTLTGYLFYSFWNYKFCALMLISTLVSYFAGLALFYYQDERRRKFVTTASIVVDLSILGFFKYYNFFRESWNDTVAAIAPASALPFVEIVLPIGISFYTFHTISYVVDCYRRKITPTRNFFEFSCYVSLFSQLVAGPIVRFGEIERDLATIDQKNRVLERELAWYFIGCGMIKKVVLADSLANCIDPALQNYQHLSGLEAWICAFGYSYQLYFDFSGYSDLAVGLGLLFNIHIPQNFDSPFKAVDFRDFWRRWHISLSRCLRDYLYIPLGGSHHGVSATYRNLMITMLLGGLWHGANWTFVIWGAYHGILLCLTHYFQYPLESVPRLLRQSVTFLLVVLGFLVFRAESIEMAAVWLSKLLEPSFSLQMPAAEGALLFLSIAAVVAHGTQNTFEKKGPATRSEAWLLILLFGFALLLINSGQPSPFLYFQF